MRVNTVNAAVWRFIKVSALYLVQNLVIVGLHVDDMC